MVKGDGCEEREIQLQPAVAADRSLISRVRAPAELAYFVHFNWFWLDRALEDPLIDFRIVRIGPRFCSVGCVAFGPHEPVDFDPSSRIMHIGEIYHIVIDRRVARRGLGARVIGESINALTSRNPDLTAVRVAHHVANAPAARLYARLGFAQIGEKVDHETGDVDTLLEKKL